MGLVLFKCCYSPQVPIVYPGKYHKELRLMPIPMIGFVRHRLGA